MASAPPTRPDPNDVVEVPDAEITVCFPGSPEFVFLASDLTLRQQDQARKIIAGLGLDVGPDAVMNIVAGQAIVAAKARGIKVAPSIIVDTPTKHLRKQIRIRMIDPADTDDTDDESAATDGFDPQP